MKRHRFKLPSYTIQQARRESTFVLTHILAGTLGKTYALVITVSLNTTGIMYIQPRSCHRAEDKASLVSCMALMAFVKMSPDISKSFSPMDHLLRKRKQITKLCPLMAKPLSPSTLNPDLSMPPIIV